MRKVERNANDVGRSSKGKRRNRVGLVASIKDAINAINQSPFFSS